MTQSRDLDLKRHARTDRYPRRQSNRRQRRGTALLLALIAAVVAGLMVSFSLAGSPPTRPRTWRAAQLSSSPSMLAMAEPQTHERARKVLAESTQ